MAKVGELLVDVLARTTGLQKGLKKGEQSLSKFKASVRSSIGTLSQLAGVAGGFAGFGFAQSKQKLRFLPCWVAQKPENKCFLICRNLLLQLLCN